MLWFQYSSWVPGISLVWSDIDVTIVDNGSGNGDAILSGITGSYIYTTDTVTLTFTYYF
jgi:hypothetical protein